MLTEAAIRAAKPKDKAFKVSDGGGLFLLVNPNGSRLWRLGYRFAGKQKLLALGAYPEVSLKDARGKRDTSKSLLAAGIDPSAQRKSDKAQAAVSQENSFNAIADELLAKKRREGKSEATLGKNEWALSFARPALGDRPIKEITAADVLAVLRQIEARGRHETAGRLRALIGQVFRYAIATARAVNDPTFALRGALTTPTTKHRPAIIDPKAFGALLRAIDGYTGDPATTIALKLLALTFVRPGELRNATWSEFDLAACVWSIPAGRMKMRREHRVPLAPQTIDLLNELRVLTGHGRYLFPSVRSADRCVSENTINGALRRLGYGKDDVTGHGFRASASSMLNESGQWSGDAIERQLAHADPDEVRRAYQRADFWAERVRMMAWWANRCDAMRQGGAVIDFSEQRA